MGAVHDGGRTPRKRNGMLTASEVAGVVAVVSAGTYFFRYLSMRLQITAVHKKLPVGYDLESIVERAEAEAFILAVGACVFALLNTLLVDYGRLAARLEKVGATLRDIDRKKTVGRIRRFCVGSLRRSFGEFHVPASYRTLHFDRIGLVGWKNQ